MYCGIHGRIFQLNWIKKIFYRFAIYYTEVQNQNSLNNLYQSSWCKIISAQYIQNTLHVSCINLDTSQNDITNGNKCSIWPCKWDIHWYSIYYPSNKLIITFLKMLFILIEFSLFKRYILLSLQNILLIWIFINVVVIFLFIRFCHKISCYMDSRERFLI